MKKDEIKKYGWIILLIIALIILDQSVKIIAQQKLNIINEINVNQEIVTGIITYIIIIAMVIRFMVVQRDKCTK